MPTPTPSISPSNTPTPTPTLAECAVRNVQIAISNDMLYNYMSGRRAEKIKIIMAGEGCCGESNTLVIDVPSITPTPTPTPTNTMTPTNTPTNTVTPTQSQTNTPTPTQTITL